MFMSLTGVFLTNLVRQTIMYDKNMQKLLTFIFFEHFLLCIFCPKKKNQTTLILRDLKNGKNLNNQTLLNDSPVYIHVFTLFCIIQRNFWLSQEVHVLQNWNF